jgi:hypothetical protein
LCEWAESTDGGIVVFDISLQTLNKFLNDSVITLFDGWIEFAFDVVAIFSIVIHAFNDIFEVVYYLVVVQRFVFLNVERIAYERSRHARKDMQM